MHPELFQLPFVHVTVKSYGTMMVIGFLVAVWLMRRLMRREGQNPEDITNLALYALIAGVVGARIMYVIDYWPSYRDDPLSVFAVWQGGLVYLGGVILAIIVVLLYLRLRHLPVRTYMDVLSIGLMLGLSFGRIGCFLNGCCFGKVTDLPLGVRFPYGSPAYLNQVFPNPDRGRDVPLLDLPAGFYGYLGENGQWYPVEDEKAKWRAGLKPWRLLTDEERDQVTRGPYQALPVHPTELYSSANAAVLCLILCLFWRRIGRLRPGTTFSLMFILYGSARFVLETLRDDNPFLDEWWTIYRGGTESQNLGIYMAAAGLVLLIVFWIRGARKTAADKRS